jgi:hypothetical protein
LASANVRADAIRMYLSFEMASRHWTRFEKIHPAKSRATRKSESLQP